MDRTGGSPFGYRRAVAALLLLALSSVSLATPARAQSFIRDAEIEATIRGWATPLLRAAGLSPNDVQLHIVKSDQLNAFVAGGLRIFIYTGLLRRTKSPEEVIGVLAHEIGHIQGGHLARTRDEMANASAQAILFAVLGVVAAVASGDGRVGAAVGAFGQTAALKSLLQYSRTQESAADQAALRLMDATGQSAKGLESFLSVLGDQELLLPEQQDPYLRTHPISRERVAALQQHLETSRYSDVPSGAESRAAHARMKAKLDGFLAPFGSVLREYPERDTSTPALIARAVAYHRTNRLAETDAAIDALRTRLPQDPFIQELYGQILFERGDNTQAIEAYKRAYELAPNEPLIAIAYAQALVVAPGTADLDLAVKLLERAVRQDSESGGAWRTLGTAYGRQGQLGEAALALAESESRFGRADLAFQQASRAQTLLKTGSPAWLRAEDIRQAAERALIKRAEH
tara:strand:+ start:149 stop:1528 length:1380 start_codon:yes stop_codon:yes gene_type:complete